MKDPIRFNFIEFSSNLLADFLHLAILSNFRITPMLDILSDVPLIPEWILHRPRSPTVGLFLILPDQFCPSRESLVEDCLGRAIELDDEGNGTATDLFGTLGVSLDCIRAHDGGATDRDFSMDDQAAVAEGRLDFAAEDIAIPCERFLRPAGSRSDGKIRLNTKTHC